MVVAALGACMDGASGPDRFGVGYFELAPLLPAAVQDGQFPLGVDGIGLRMLRSETGEVVVDTMIPFDPDSSAVHLAVRVGMLRPVEEFEAHLALQAGTLVLFSGSKLIFLKQGPPGTNGVDSVSVRYQGPGRDIAAIAIQPPEAIIRLGDSLQFRVAAVDSSGDPVPQFFVSWGVSDAAPGRLNALGWLRALNARSAVTVTATTPNGAAATARAVLVPAPTGLRLVGADTVVAPVGTAARFGVRVVAADSLGVPGVPVRFSAATAGGSVTDSVVLSDSAGVAATQVLLGDTLRVYRYEAHAEGLETERLTVDAVAGPPAALSITAGNAQSAPVASELPTALAVRVRDAHGNAVAGQRVNFVVTSGGGSVWAGSNNTNDSGLALERWTLGTSTALTQRLEARAVDNTTGAPLLFAVFSATAVPGPADGLVGVGGDGQSGTVGGTLAESLAVRVEDRFGNPVPEVPVQWETDAGTLTAGSGSSDAQGISRAAWVLGTAAGTYHATATGSALPAVQFTSTATAGAPAAMAVSGGDGLAGVVGEALTEALAVRVSDEYGNPVPGVSLTWTTGDGGTVTSDGPTDADGVAHAVWQMGTVAGPQTAQAATAGLTAGFSATAEVGPPAQVTVSGSGTTLAALGSQLTLDAQVRDAFGNEIPSPTLSWTSSDPSVALVDTDGRVTARGNGTVRVTATVAGSVAGFADLTVEQAVAAGTLSPEQATLEAVGASVQLQLTALDANGNPVGDPAVTWTSSNLQVATVSDGGLVTAVGAGSVTITATVSGNVVETASLSVVPTVAGIEMSPQGGTLTALGATLSLQATAVDAQGSPVTGVSPSWRSTDVSVATVSDAGVVTAVANGSATITASADGFTGTVEITVAQVVSSVAVSPASASLTAVGATVQLSATATDANGHPVSGPVTWTSSAPEVAGVDGAGLVTAVGNGTATITAASGAASGTAEMTVAQVVSSVAVDPASASLTAVGATVQLSATATDANGHPVSGPVTWTSSAPEVAGVDAAGLVTAVANGTATVTASSGGKTGSAVVTVSLPPTIQMVVIRAGQGGKTIQLGSSGNTPVAVLTTSTASGEAVTFDASTVDPSTVRFEGVEPASWSLADVDDDGDDDLQLHFTTAALAMPSGNVTVTLTGLTTGGTPIEGHETVTVLAPSPPAPAPPQVGSVEVTPGSVALTALGATQQLTATVYATDQSVLGDAAVTWTSSAPGVAGVDAAGLVTAVAKGTATVTAGSDGVVGSATVTVSQETASVAVSPASASLLALGATVQLSATLADANGHPVSGPVTWTSSAPGVAGVDAAGLVTAVANGTATITAASGAASGTAEVTVAQVVSSVVVDPASASLSAVGATQQLEASVADANGYPVGGSVTWISSDGTVATVNGGGLVTAVGNGTATVTATSGGVSASVLVSVTLATEPLTVVVLVRPDENDWWTDRGSRPRPINLDADGVTWAAILTTSTRRGEIVTFNAMSVNPLTVRLAGAAPVGWTFRDLRHDGDWDLMLRFRTRDLHLTPSSTKAVLEAKTYRGQAIRGEADVWVVPPLFWWFSKGR